MQSIGNASRPRGHLYAGACNGADVAAWKQAARAELAATSSHQTGYGQGLLDLIKAFERIPHPVFVREVVALGYPLWMFRRSVGDYELTKSADVWEQKALLFMRASTNSRKLHLVKE